MWFWWSKSLGLNILFREEHTGEPSVVNGAKIQPLYKPTILNPRDRVWGELETRVSPGKPRKGQLYSSARQRGPQQAKAPRMHAPPRPPRLEPCDTTLLHSARVVQDTWEPKQTIFLYFPIFPPLCSSSSLCSENFAFNCSQANTHSSVASWDPFRSALPPPTALSHILRATCTSEA